MLTLTWLFMKRWATFRVNKCYPESTIIINNQPKRLDHCHIRTTAVVTLVPRLWNCRDNSFGTVVKIGIGIVRLLPTQISNPSSALLQNHWNTRCILCRKLKNVLDIYVLSSKKAIYKGRIVIWPLCPILTSPSLIAWWTWYFSGCARMVLVLFTLPLEAFILWLLCSG